MYEIGKICPINPHGNGYCQENKCALWDTDSNIPGCSIFHACRALCDTESEIQSINRNGIVVYVKDDRN